MYQKRETLYVSQLLHPLYVLSDMNHASCSSGKSIVYRSSASSSLMSSSSDCEGRGSDSALRSSHIKQISAIQSEMCMMSSSSDRRIKISNQSWDWLVRSSDAQSLPMVSRTSSSLARLTCRESCFGLLIERSLLPLLAE